MSRNSIGLLIMVLLLTPQNAVAAVVYSNDFSTAAGPEWSSQSIAVAAGRQFLGRFRNDEVSLRLSNLPPHTKVTINFDLFVLGTWDGSQLVDPLSTPTHFVGPDVWEMILDDSVSLLRTTFSVFDGTKAMHSFRSYPQAFPGSFPTDQNPARLGAIENDSLGEAEGDSVYRMQLSAHHVSGELQLEFHGEMPSLDAEDWGLDNLSVAVTPPLPGDANLDDLVDGADYTIWADHFKATGATWTQGDFTGDGIVSGADYTVWADHSTPAPVSAAIPVPEPAAVTLCAIAAALLLSAVPRRRVRG